VAVRKRLQAQNSRDFGVQFWVIATIDIFNFQPDLCVARVALKESAVCSSKIKIGTYLYVEVQRSDSR
jgi:hypothetical protein